MCRAAFRLDMVDDTCQPTWAVTEGTPWVWTSSMTEKRPAWGGHGGHAPTKEGLELALLSDTGDLDRVSFNRAFNHNWDASLCFCGLQQLDSFRVAF